MCLLADYLLAAALILTVNGAQNVVCCKDIAV